MSSTIKEKSIFDQKMKIKKLWEKINNLHFRLAEQQLTQRGKMRLENRRTEEQKTEKRREEKRREEKRREEKRREEKRNKWIA
jgi:predicted nucleic acid-binding protein